MGDPARAGTDIGPMITAGARDRFDAMIRATVEAGRAALAGAERIAGPGCYYAPPFSRPTGPRLKAPCRSVWTGDPGPRRRQPRGGRRRGQQQQLRAGASVWGRNRRTALAIARQVEAGMVSVNEAVTPTAHAGTPFGGWKASGIGRTHGAIGLRKFVQPQAVFERGPGGFRPQLFPYTGAPMVERMLTLYCRLFHPRVRQTAGKESH